MTDEHIGKYKILEKRGEGGFGVLYKALDAMIDRVVALKVLHPEYAASERLANWFKREARAMARLNHPNIVTIHNFEVEDDRHFIVMEYVDGVDLDSVIKTRGKLPIDEILGLMSQMLSAFGYAHSSGIVHRDIKPSNIMIDTSGRVKITDFGIAKILDDSKMTKTGMGAGSLHYMSPEQVEGKLIDTRTDIYSLGITLYQMITGNVPFTDDSDYIVMRAHLDQTPDKPSDLRQDVPPDLERVVMKMLEKKPEDRYESMSAVADDLGELGGKEFVASAAVSGSPADIRTRTVSTPKPRYTPPDRRESSDGEKSAGWRRFLIPAGAAAALIVTTVVVLLFVFGGDSTETDEPVVSDTTSVAVVDTIEVLAESDKPSDTAMVAVTEQEPIDTAEALTSVDQSSDSIPTTSDIITPSEEDLPGGRLLVEIAPFDYRNPPRVVLDGREFSVDDIPLEITGIKTGWHQLSVHFAGESFFESVYVDRDIKTKTYRFNGPVGRVSIGAEFIGMQQRQPWAKIIVDEKPIEQGTPTAIELVEGPHKIMVKKKDFVTVGKAKFIYVKAGENTVVNFKLRRK